MNEQAKPRMILLPGKKYTRSLIQEKFMQEFCKEIKV